MVPRDPHLLAVMPPGPLPPWVSWIEHRAEKVRMMDISEMRL